MLRYLWLESMLVHIFSQSFSNEVLLLFEQHSVLAKTAEKSYQTRHIVIKEIHISTFTKEAQIVALAGNHAVQPDEIVVTNLRHFNIWLHMQPFNCQQSHS